MKLQNFILVVASMFKQTKSLQFQFRIWFRHIIYSCQKIIKINVSLSSVLNQWSRCKGTLTRNVGVVGMAHRREKRMKRSTWIKELKAERTLTNDTCLDIGQLTAEGNVESSTPLTNQWEACRDAEAWLRLGHNTGFNINTTRYYNRSMGKGDVVGDIRIPEDQTEKYKKQKWRINDP